MITPHKRTYTKTEVKEQLGEIVGTSGYNSLVGILEKAPSYISKYGLESSFELKLIKREKGLQIQIRHSFNDHVNFILFDEDIIEITWREYTSDRSKTRLSGFAIFLFTVFAFVIDGVFNDSRLKHLPLFFGLIMGMLASLLSPISRKKTASILANVDNEHIVLILSNVRKYEFKKFFTEYYPDIQWNNK